jgi:hypothetical protein
MREQMADGDPRRVGGGIAQIFQLRHVPLGRIVERQLSFVAQLQDRHRGEALGHRGDPEDGVLVDRRLGVHVAQPGDAGMRKLAVDDDAPRRAGDVSRLRELGEQAVDVGERGREPGAPVGDAELRRGRQVRAGGETDESEDQLAHGGGL